MSTWAVDLCRVGKTFRGRTALGAVTLRVARGEVHALLGSNGAGKTTALRIAAGLTVPDTGTCQVGGEAPSAPGSRRRPLPVGLVPAGDRTFYLRLSGWENLRFFGRLQGLPSRRAAARAERALRQVGLEDAARQSVGLYSHGMQKRLSVARALLTSPAVLLVDEATHDLDPEGAARVRGLVRGLADEGTAVIWATQRIEEIQGFADRVTVLHQGDVRFQGAVPELLRRTCARTYWLDLRDSGRVGDELDSALAEALSDMGTIQGEGSAYRLALADGVALGEALAALATARFTVLDCREDRPPVERAFLSLIDGEGQ